jgi:hypothetical protein
MILNLISTGIGTLLGLGKKWLKNKEEEAKHKRALEIEREVTRREEVRITGTKELEAIKHGNTMAEIMAKTSADVTMSAHRHDEAIKDSTFWGKFRISVRPVITYAYKIFYVWVTVFFMYKAVQLFNELPLDIKNYDLYKDFYNTIISDWFKTTFSTILGFWFGQR